EAALTAVPGVVRTESRAGDGRAYIDLFFTPDHDIDRALRDVSQAAQQARGQIPPDFPEPRIFAVSTMEEPALQIAFSAKGMGAAKLRGHLRSTIVPRLRAVSGVEAVFIGREEIPELVVDIEPRRQLERSLPLAVIEEALVQATRAPTSGAIRSSTFEGLGLLGVDGWDPAQLEAQRLILGPDIDAIELSTIARVHRQGSEDRLYTRHDGEPAVLVTIHRARNAHTLRLASAVRDIVDELAQTDALRDVRAEILHDDSVVARGAVMSVIAAAIGGALLAMMLLAIFLRRRRHIPLVAVTVLISLAASILILHILGLTLNLLTLAGLLLSVGLGLDYAIVYFDRLDRLDAAGSSHPESHVEAMLDVAGPLLGALVTTLVAVLPFLLVKGLVAMLFSSLIITVVVSAVASFLCALIILPTFSRNPSSPPSAFSGAAPHLGPWRRFQHPFVALVTVATMAGVLWFGGRALPFEVLPAVDDGFVHIRATHPAGIPTSQMDTIARDLERRLLTVDGTRSVFTTVGGYFRDGLPSFRPGTANFLVQVDTADGDRPSVAWAAAARKAMEEIDVSGLRLSITPPRIRGVQTRLAEADLIVVLNREDDDLIALSEVEELIVETLEGVDGLSDVQRMRAGVSPRWAARPDTASMALFDVDPNVLTQTVDYALDGRILRRRMAGGEPLALRVRYDRLFAGGPHQLHDVAVLSRQGHPVRLDHLVDFELIEEPTHIERREGRRVVRVAAQLSPDGPSPNIVGLRVEEALRAANLPDSVNWWLEGELEALEETRQTFTIAVLLALLAVLATLTIQYGRISFAVPAVMAIPLCGAGTVLLLLILGRPLDAIVLAGILIAIGIIANNAILVLSEALTIEQHDDLDLSDAFAAAAQARLRPIVLTTLSTVLGMSPLLFGGAEVYGLLQPLAFALTGALILSIPVTCFVLPGLVRLFHDPFGASNRRA
ncbi:MAG: efflux RND transporter permease subunit, partial [Bradymonadaceae bacterium]